MMNDFTYCYGKNCRLREQCLRYLEGKALMVDGFRFMENCNEENREGFVKI